MKLGRDELFVGNVADLRVTGRPVKQNLQFDVIKSLQNYLTLYRSLGSSLNRGSTVMQYLSLNYRSGIV